MPNARRKGGAKDGQSLVESCIVICLIALVFAGLFQISQLFAAREILYHAAARGARAKTVGLNWWMVEKSIRVASIPNAGRLTTPPFQNVDTTLETMAATLKPGTLWERTLGIVPSSLQYNLERARVPEYLYSDNPFQGSYVLDYADWDTISGDHGSGPGDPIIHVRVRQDYPLRIPIHRAFYDDDSVQLEGESYIENHYPLYIDDQFW
jgi:hypothetical protein